MAPEAARASRAKGGCVSWRAGWQPAAEWRRVETGCPPLADWRQHGLAATARVAAQALLRRADELYVSVDIRVADVGFAGRGRT
jgi:hypothetical protein